MKQVEKSLLNVFRKGIQRTKKMESKITHLTWSDYSEGKYDNYV